MPGEDLETYGLAIAAMRRLRDGGDEASAVAAGERLGQAMAKSSEGLLALSWRTTAGDAGLGHAVNVAILSCAAAGAAGWSTTELRALAVWGLLHDWRRGPGPELSREEREAVLHPGEASSLFEQAAAIEAAPIARGLPLQERVRPSHKSPGGKARRSTNLAALIVALSHLYESLTHPRAWRPAQPPHLVLLRLLNNLQRGDDDEVITGFSKGVTLYPPGALVELSDGEIATVLSINPEHPTRPAVLIQLNALGNAMRPGLRLDLASMRTVSIKRSLPPGRPPAGDVRSAVRAAAESWWYS